MTDDLVKTLRTPNGILDWEYRIKCADRIELLEARVNYQSELLLGLDKTQLLRIEKLEAALREIAGGTNGESEFRLMDIARDALEGK